MDGDVNNRSQGPESYSVEHTNRDTNRKIAFCSFFIECLFGIPSYLIGLLFFQL